MASEKKELKILLVDDDKFLLDMYSLKFKKSGLSVDVSSSATSAYEKLKSGENFDIILLDIIMPGMDGIELLSKIRTEKISKDSVVIMLTNQADDYEKAKSLGIEGYIIKATTIPSEVVEKVMSIYKSVRKS
jgi:CheY-like chemotaxis protein